MVKHIILFLPCVMACWGNFGPEDVDGSYELISVDGTTLPATVTTGPGAPTTVESSELALRADGTWILSLSTVIPDGAPGMTMVDTTSGTFVVRSTSLYAPKTIHLTDSADGRLLEGFVDHNDVFLAWRGVTLVYERARRT